MRKIFSKIRFLPITIFAATLMLTVRVGDIWQGIDILLDGSIKVSQATAQETAEQPPAAEPSPQESAAVPEETTLGAAPTDEGGGATVQEDPTRLISDDPTLLTPAEIEILMRLAERRDSLEKREREIDAREGLLRAAEIRIERRVAELENLRGVIEDRIQVFDKQQEEKLKKEFAMSGNGLSSKS